jgi:threonine dehydratase
MGFSRRLLWLDIPSRSRTVSIFPRFPEASMTPLSCQRIAEAVDYIDAEFLGTPQFEADAIGRRFGGRLVVKIETMNPVRSFKARGALFHVSQLAEPKHLVCATAGNFGQGMAYAARKHGMPITIFANVGASPQKVERMRGFGADVRLTGTSSDDARDAARAFSAATGALLVEDGREAAIAEGAGTIGVELLRWPEPFDAILVPLGDGALLGGIGSWVKTYSPTTLMIGVCAAGSTAMKQSLSRREAVSSPCATIADGIAVQTPFADSIARLSGVVDDVLLVEDDALIEGMRTAHRELGVVLEPSGAAGLAALLRDGEQFRGKRVATILTGGNLSVEQARNWLGVSLA